MTNILTSEINEVRKTLNWPPGVPNGYQLLGTIEECPNYPNCNRCSPPKPLKINKDNYVTRQK